VLVFAIRSPQIHAWRLPRNGWLLASAIASAALVAAVVYLPVAHEPFQTVSLGLGPAAVVVGLALAPFVLVELAKALARAPRANTEVAPLETGAQREEVPR